MFNEVTMGAQAPHNLAQNMLNRQAASPELIDLRAFADALRIDYVVVLNRLWVFGAEGPSEFEGSWVQPGPARARIRGTQSEIMNQRNRLVSILQHLIDNREEYARR